ncbi:phage tail protein [Streptococcus lutetiensis]|uniref:phage tail protein n=1 Tax=Streptococcus lutetiensis TaxID=150055 RepID=UPI0018A9DE78|nr:phage tail protein [Streptococcus lutetiensis]
MSKNNVRIAIRDSTDSHNVAFFDNKAGIKYKSANLHRFLAGSASILTIKYNSKDIDTIRTGCKLAFIYKERAYWLNIMVLSKKGYKVEITAYSLGLELNQEERGAHKPANAMRFAEYLAYYDPEHALELGVNEVADKRIKLEWTGTDTILARLFSIANSFDAELEFTVELNQDYSLKRQVLNVYKKGNLGSNRAASPIRVGRGLKVINYSDNLKELRTAVRATGKDGLTIDGLNKKVYDDDGNLLYYSNANTVYAPQSRDKYPSVGKKSNDNWIIKELGETEYSTKEALWGYMLGELKKICVPEITYDIEGAVDGDVGDTRTLIDDVHYDPPLYVQGRISELTEDLITGKVTKSTLTNFERKYSQVASELLKQVEQLANDAAPYTIRLNSDNGLTFKNYDGQTTIDARLEKAGKDVDCSWQWKIEDEVISNQQSLPINANDFNEKAVVVVTAFVNNKEVAKTEATLINLVEPIELQVRASNGNVFKNGVVSTSLTATLWRGDKEIDKDGTEFSYVWKKINSDETPDEHWNQSHSYSQKSIRITNVDVFRRATFLCEIQYVGKRV